MSSSPNLAPPETRQIGDRTSWLESGHLARSLSRIDELFPTRRVAAAPSDMPSRISGDIEGALVRSIDNFFDANLTSGLLVSHNGRTLFERYAPGNDAGSLFAIFSITKSITSALIGIALRDGDLSDLDRKVGDFGEDIARSAYRDVTIRHLLHMRSGSAYDEAIDSQGYARIICENSGGMGQFMLSFAAAAEPGKRFCYSSIETEVLATVLARSISMPLADYLSAKIWVPMGAERDARWLIDQPGDLGRETAGGGLQAALRDLARFGLLMAHGGVQDGVQIIPHQWAIESTTVPSANPEREKISDAGESWDYGYQWWLPHALPGVFAARGMCGQRLLVDPANKLVMAKTSFWPLGSEANYESAVLGMFAKLRDATNALC